MSDSQGVSLPTKLLITFGLNVLLVWAMATYLPQYFDLDGGLIAYIIVGALITLLNMIVRPILNIITFPLKLFATILAIIIVNGVFVQLVHWFVLNMRQELLSLEIYGGVWGWVVVASCFGIANWFLKEAMKR